MKSSIYTKILLFSLITIILTIVIVVVRNVNVQSELIRSSLLQKGKVISNMLAEISDAPLYDLNITQLNLLLSNFSNSSDIVESFITNENKIILGAGIRKNNKFITGLETQFLYKKADFSINKRINFKKNYLEIITPIKSDYAKGFIFIKFSLSQITKKIKYSNRKILEVGFFALIVVFFVSSIIAFKLTKPLNILMEMVKKIQIGKYETRSEIKTNDEFHELSVTLNKMAEQIEKNVNDLDKKIQQLSKIRDISNRISSVFDLNDLLKVIVDSICGILNSDRCSVMLLNSSGTDFFIKIGKGFSDDDSIKYNIPLSFHSPVAQHIYENRKPLIVTEENHKDVLKNIDKDQYFTKSFMSVPLSLNDKLIGIMNITNKQGKDSNYTNDDLDLLITFAQQVVIAIHNSELHNSIIIQEVADKELEIARNIQLALYPEAPEMKEFDIAVSTNPARQVGGDYYDFIKFNENEVGIAVGDISGKGVPAAILMAMVKSFLQAKNITNIETDKLISDINNFVYDQVKGQKYLTLFLAKIELETKKFIYTNGGHVEPLLLKKNGKVEKLFTEDLIIGLFDDAVFHKKEVILEKDDILLLYTDGINEAMDNNKNFFGDDRIEKILKENIRSSSRQIIASILTELNNFKKDCEQHDDETIMVIKVI